MIEPNDSVTHYCVTCLQVIHEATMENSLKEQAIEFGHSTPEMAAKFALESKSKRLCINHLSPRYRPISSIKNGKIVTFL
jgi:ribonuclease Z